MGVDSQSAATSNLSDLWAPQQVSKPQSKYRSEPAYQNPFQAVEPGRNCSGGRRCGISARLRAGIH